MNPMFSLLNRNKISSVQDMMRMVQTAGNPQAAMSQLMQSNPMMAQVMQYVQQNGGDAKAAFYKAAQDMGIDPNSVLSQLR